MSNCTEEYVNYQDGEKILLGYCALPFIFMGLLANAMSVRIFSHKHMRQQSINWYLIILAISDSVVLIGAFFVLSLPRLGEIYAYWKATSISYYSTPLLYALMTLAQTVSVWMTTAMSIHRFIGVCLPFKAGTVLQKQNVQTAIIVVVITSILFNTTRFFEVTITEVCWMPEIGAELPILTPTDLRTNETYSKIFYGWAYTLIMFAIPFTILIVVNSCVICAVHRSRKVHSRLHYDEENQKAEIAKEITTSLMLVTIVVAFLGCNTLAFVVNIMEQLGMVLGNLVSISNMLVVTNACINICIYCLFSEKYRTLLRFYLLSTCKCSRDTNFEIVLSNF